VARLNFSHGTHADHAELVQLVRQVALERQKPVAIMQDLQGPKIRLGVLPEEGIQVVQDTVLTLDTSQATYTKGKPLPVDFDKLHTFIKPGERLFINDGRVECRVENVAGTVITMTVVVGGLLTSHKGINVPDTALFVRALTDKDKEDLVFGVKSGVDFVAVSFVTGPEDVIDVKYLLKQAEIDLKLPKTEPIRVIAKIERHEAVDRIEAILSVADGIMVARGDLGVEVPPQQVPLLQKKLIEAALHAGKPVIVATQMLDSMQDNPRPTRAEVSDVANAVFDHADAVMLSNETATGHYPIQTVRMMSSIVSEAEASSYDNLVIRDYGEKRSVDDVVSKMSRLVAEEIDAKGILAASLSGDTARRISRHRPELPIFVATASERVYRQLTLSWGVESFVLPECKSIEELVERSLVSLKEHALVATGDKIIIVAGEPVGEGHVNLLEVREIE
jgi:pyruvate kinase